MEQILGTDTINEIDFNNETEVFGQRTLAHTRSEPTQGRSEIIIHHRRTVSRIRDVVGGILSQYTNQINSDELRNSVKEDLSNIFGGMITRHDIIEYRVVCDETNNLPETIDNGDLIVDTYVQPIREYEFIQLRFTVTGTNHRTVTEIDQTQTETEKYLERLGV